MMSDYEVDKKLSGLKPLTEQDLRDLWVAAPYPETKKLLWEIRRLHKIIGSLHRTSVALTAGHTGAESVFASAARDLLKEPCVQAYIAKSSERPLNEAWLDEELSILRATASARYIVPVDNPKG